MSEIYHEVPEIAHSNLLDNQTLALVVKMTSHRNNELCDVRLFLRRDVMQVTLLQSNVAFLSVSGHENQLGRPIGKALVIQMEKSIYGFYSPICVL